MTAFAVPRVTSVDPRSLVTLLAVISTLIVVPAQASADQHATTTLQYDSWTTDNGLPQNSVNDILQTRDGYLWLATYGGLVRFDGVRFAVFDRSFEGIGSL